MSKFISSLSDISLQIFGVQYDSERLYLIEKELNDVLIEIEKLRTLKLEDVSPSVIFNPEATYKGDIK